MFLILHLTLDGTVFLQTESPIFFLQLSDAHDKQFLHKFVKKKAKLAVDVCNKVCEE